MKNSKEELLADIPFNAASPQLIDLVADTLTDEITLDVMNDVTIAGGAASGTVLPEGTQRQVAAVRIYEAGEPIIDIGGDALYQITERESKKALSGVNLATGDIQGPTSIRQQLRLRFATPLLGDHGFETALRPRDPKKKFQLEITWAPVLKTVLVSAANDRVFTYANTICRVTQSHDPGAFASFRPLYLPRIVRSDVAVAAAQANLQVPIDTLQRVRAILLHQISDTVSTDLISQFNLRDDGREYKRSVFARTSHEKEQGDFGGATDQVGYLFFNLAENQRLGNTWGPQQGAHLKFECTVTHPGTVDLIRAYRFELVKVPGVTAEKDF